MYIRVRVDEETERYIKELSDLTGKKNAIKARAFKKAVMDELSKVKKEELTKSIKEERLRNINNIKQLIETDADAETIRGELRFMYSTFR